MGKEDWGSLNRMSELDEMSKEKIRAKIRRIDSLIIEKKIKIKQCRGVLKNAEAVWRVCTRGSGSRYRSTPKEYDSSKARMMIHRLEFEISRLKSEKNTLLGYL